MERLDLYKVVMFYDNDDVMKLIAAVNKSIDSKKAKKLLVTQLYNNYIEDNKVQYSKEVLDDCVKYAKISKLGTLETDDPILVDTEDFSFILLERK